MYLYIYTNISDNIITDPRIYPRATYSQGESEEELPAKHVRAFIKQSARSQSAQHWASLKLQGIGWAGLCGSFIIALRGYAVGEDITSRFSLQDTIWQLGIHSTTTHTVLCTHPPMKMKQYDISSMVATFIKGSTPPGMTDWSI